MNNKLVFNKDIFIDDFLLIKNFNICVEKGKNIIVLGNTGSGKTTCLKTMKKHYKYNKKVAFGIIKDNMNKEDLLSYLEELLKMDIDYLFLDDLSVYLDSDNLLSYFNKLKKRNITYIYFTTDTNTMFSFSYCLVLYKGCVAIEGNPYSFIKEEKLFNRLGFEFSFYYRLSSNLVLYNVLDNVCYDEKSLEESLWDGK